MLTACAIHYGLDVGLVAWYMGGEYTADYRDLEAKQIALEPHINSSDYDHITRFLVEGAPHEFDWEETQDNKMKAIRAGNQILVQRNPRMVQETLNKEERNSHIAPFYNWVCRFSSNARHTSQGMVIKEGKNSRLVWDGTNKQECHQVTMNDITPTETEPLITFGHTKIKALTHIYNTRISFPHREIHCAAPDKKACFRFVRIFADLVGAFGFTVGYYFIATAMVFGSIVSASCWEPFRRAIKKLNEIYYKKPELETKYAGYLEQVKFEPIP